MFHRFAELGPIELVPGVTRQMLSVGERIMVVRIVAAKGSEVPLHTHPHEQVGHVESGRARFRIGDDEQVVETGDGYSVPSNVPHAVVMLEDCVFVDVFSPPRDEYRQ